MYVEVVEFKDGEFQKRFSPFYTKTAFAVFDKAVAKYNVVGKEAIIAMRNDDHTLVKAWGNVKERPKYGIKLKQAKAGKR